MTTSGNGETRRRPETILDPMHRDFEACWRASESRDPRFDGRFFVGVHTTGVYCRPVCPAPSPKRENVRFYPTAAAAETAGLRPCRRCRPETAPGTPEWIGGSALVARGLRLISDGFLDRGSVGALARELCVGERQLRRLFVVHLGAPPLAVARTRRLQLARLLIDQTNMSMTEVAAGAGFGSLRRFNEAVRDAFGRAPSELRRAGRRRPAGGLALRLAYRPPFAWDALLGFLALRSVPGVEEVHGRVYRRTLSWGGTAGVVELEPAAGTPELTFRLRLPSLDGLAGLVERARQALDLDADPLQIATTFRSDRRLRAGVERLPGLRVPGTFDPFELTVRAVLGQQVSVLAARTLAGRLVRRFGERLPEPDGTLTHVFPGPEALTGAKIEAIGIPASRAETIRRLARAVTEEGLELGPTSAPDELRARLGEIRGIGPWTIEYVAMRALRDPDAFPASDLGLRYALSPNGQPAPAAEVTRRAAAWRPWRAYAAVYLWQSLAETELAAA
jgi:AraC family transcriptional regulator of adaptative response / DNA-3-methyladenine glycosylase II